MRLPVFRVGLLGSQVTLVAFLARLVILIATVVWAGAAAAADSKLLAVGGTNGSYLDRVEEYDFATDAWTTKTSLPSVRSELGLATAGNGKVYAVGGWNGAALDIVQEYDPVTNAWTTRAPMPTARYSFGLAAASNGKLYAVGGHHPTLGYLSTVEEYDPVTNIWSTKASLPAARSSLRVIAASNGKLYAVGGYNGSSELATVTEYDPATDVWTPKTSMPTPRYELGLAAASNGKLYAVGGYNAGSRSEVEEYNPATNTWATKTPLQTPRAGLGLSAASNGKLYAVGGYNGPALATVEEYDPATDDWAFKTSMPGGARYYQGVASFPDPTTATTITSSPNPSAFGQPATFTTWVSASGRGLPTGDVTFTDDVAGELDTVALEGVAGQAIAAGAYHACAIIETGGVECWGYNRYGQLGVATNNETEDPNPAPVEVDGLSSDVVALTAGYYHTCALTSEGGVKCWGSNQYGQLGDPTNAQTDNPNPTPVEVEGLSGGVVAIAAGSYHTCALTAAGGIKCWGLNQYGALGVETNNGNALPNSTPVDVDGLSRGVVAIAGGDVHTCALTSEGGVKCWGYNFFGQLGIATNTGTDNANPAPVDVTDLSGGVTAISAGLYHTCALTESDGVKCWGRNFYGQLGVAYSGTDSANPTPVDVGGLSSGVAAITAGHHHTCALMDDDTVKCWGFNRYGQLGNATNNNTNNPNPTPATVAGLNGGVAAFGGSSHTCALTESGGVKCWGQNQYGQLGNATSSGTNNPNPTPLDVNGLTALLIAKASLVIDTLAIGEHSITADYSGDATHSASSDALVQQVDPIPTSTDLQSSDESSGFGELVTFTANVTVPSGVGMPTGTVSFRDNDTEFGADILNASGFATYDTDTLGLGSHSITAVYLGGGNHAGSTSDPLEQTVSDEAAPVVTVPADIFVYTDPGAATAVVDYVVSATDDVDGEITPTLTAGFASGSAFPVGPTLVTYEATDTADNTGSASFTVTVTDNEAPVVTVPADFTVATDPGLDTAVVEYAVSATDNVDGAITPTRTAGPASGDAFPLGDTIVTYEATDAAENGPASNSFTVTVTDAPTLGGRLLAVGGFGDDGM